MKKVWIFQGGWDGHEPKLTSKRFGGLLEKHGYTLSLIHIFGKFPQRVGHDSVQDAAGHRRRRGGAYHAELEFVAGERKGGGAIAVGAVLGQPGKGRHPGFQQAGGCLGNCVAVSDMLQNTPELVAQENGDDCLLYTPRGSGHGGDGPEADSPCCHGVRRKNGRLL